MKDSTNNDADDAPPMAALGLNTWNRVYAVVVAWLLFCIAVFAYLTERYP